MENRDLSKPGLRTGPGLFQFLEDEHTYVKYSPFGTEPFEVPYELTEEDHIMFDEIDGTKEEVQKAKDTYIKLKGTTSKDFTDYFVDTWVDIAKKRKNARNLVIHAGDGGIALLDECLKDKYK